MTEVARRRTRARIRLIKIQWLLILALIVALIISFVTRPSASVPDEPESSPVRVEAPEPITETSAPEPELIELGEFKTTAYCTCVKCCGTATRTVTSPPTPTAFASASISNHQSMNPRGLVPRGERRMTLWDLKICGLRKATAAPSWQKSAESATRKSVILRSVSSSLRISRSKRLSSSRRLSTAGLKT